MSAWTQARINLLKRLWPEGRSAETIALELGGGLTRNAVLGKVARLGLSEGRTPAGLPARRTPGPACDDLRRRDGHARPPPDPGRRPRSGPSEAGIGQGGDVHHHRGRDRCGQSSDLAEPLRAAAAGGAGRQPAGGRRQGAARRRGGAHRRRAAARRLGPLGVAGPEGR